MSGQSISDRLTAAKHSIAGQGLAKTVCKSTTEELMGPKRKHLDYLLQCTNEPNVSIPQLADLLIERTQNSSWVIVFKALITIHNLMNYGNERFTQYLASNNCSFNLSSFVDKTGVQGYDMSTFIRRYAKFLNEKAVSYRAMAFDFCKVKRGRDDGLLRTMNTDKLLKSLPALQKLIDALLEFDCTANELTNGVINACFMLMFKDLIRLFACYNDGTINLLEKYFDMNKKNCKEALDIYKKFLVRMDKVSEFLKVAENVGIDKGDIPDLAKGLTGKEGAAPASLLDALEEHLKSLDSKKGGGVAGPKPSGFNSAVSAMASNSSIQVSEEERKKILEDEGKQLQQLKAQKSKDLPGASSPSQPAPSTNNPFGNQQQPVSAMQNASPSRPSDDLLNLTGNPFVENVQSVMNMTSAANAFGAPTGQSGWGATPFTAGGGFADNNFASFPNGTNGTTGTSMSTLDSSTTVTSALPLAPSPATVPAEDVSFDPYEPLVAMATGDGVSSEALGGDLFGFSSGPSENMPEAFQPSSLSPSMAPEPGFDAFGEILQPQGTPTKQTNVQVQEKLSNQNLDSNLALLAGSISINGAEAVKKQQHQWQPRNDQKLTGGTHWQPPPISQATSATWGGAPQQQVPARQMMNYGQQQPGMQPMMQPGMAPMRPPMMMGGMAPMGNMPMTSMPQMGMGQPMYGNMAPGMQPMGMPMQQPPASQPNDPFGAL